jgi:ABC-type antimicrobial peptide transport system permease subunit
MPGFLFSSYQVLANDAPLLIPMDQYAYLAFRTFDYAEQVKSYSDDQSNMGDSTSRVDASAGPGAADTSAGAADGATATNATTTNTTNSSTSPSASPSPPSSSSTAGLPFRKNPYTSADAVPKQRLLVRMRSDSTAQQRQVLQNALTAVVGSGVSATFSSLVVDTKSLIEETEVANTALTLFLNIIAVIIMILCFLVNLVSFAANVSDNAREFAVLRALGLRSRQVIKVYITEAVVLVTSSFLLGSIIGILVAVSLTLQFNLFIESPFIFNFPTTLFLILAVLGLAVAAAAAYFPSSALVSRQIAGVLKSG